MSDLVDQLKKDLVSKEEIIIQIRHESEEQVRLLKDNLEAKDKKYKQLKMEYKILIQKQEQTWKYLQ